jgi:SAM-dependent methyltransferase
VSRAADWAELCAPVSAPAWQAVAEATAVGDGTRVLDLGCGTGEFCRLAADRGAIASGIDASEDMLAVASRAAPAADLRRGDLEQLPWPDDTFDVVTAFNAIQFADELTALREASRAVRPGGRVAVCNWRGPEHSELLRVTRALRGAPATSPPARDESRGAAPAQSRPAALGEPGVLEELARAAGLEPVEDGEVAAVLEVPDLDTLERALVATGVAGPAIERLGRDAVRATMAGAAEPFRRPDGAYRFDNVFRYVVSRA